jgi:hypothetical protein
MWTDPIVEEVRDERKRIEAACENDFNELLNRAKEIQSRFQGQIVSKPQRKASSKVA